MHIWNLVSGAENSGLHVFDFLANSILKEVLSAIQKGKPGAFSPGRPTEFLKNYKSSLDFLAFLEGSSHISLIYLFTLRNTRKKKTWASSFKEPCWFNLWFHRTFANFIIDTCLQEYIFTNIVTFNFMQGYCPSRLSVAKFRSEAIYTEFMKRWNIGVYFSLRCLCRFTMVINLE